MTADGLLLPCFWKCVTLAKQRSTTFDKACRCRRADLVCSLRPRDAIWRQVTRSTLANVMAGCPTTTSQCLNKCWIINRVVLWHSLEGNSQEMLKISLLEISLTIATLKLQPYLSRGNVLKHGRPYNRMRAVSTAQLPAKIFHTMNQNTSSLPKVLFVSNTMIFLTRGQKCQ